MQETPGQYQGIGIYSVRCNVSFFYIELSYCKERQSFVIPFIAYKKWIIFIIIYFRLHCPVCSVLHILFLLAATGSYPSKYDFPETKQNSLKVAGYKPAIFSKLNFSQVIFKDF